MTSVRARHDGDRRREKGASLVEFALIAPLLFAIFLGTITGGLALSEKNSAANAVREGARVGSTLPRGAHWDTGWAIDVRNRVVELSGGDLNDADVCVRLVNAASGATVGSYSGSNCSSAPPPSTPASATTGCVVKVWSRSDADFNVLFFTQTLALKSNAVGRYERSDLCP